MEYVAETPSSGISLGGQATPLARTVLMVIGSSQISAIVKEIGVSFNGAVVGNTPVLVEIVKSTQATNGNNGQAVTPNQWRGPGNTAGAGNASLLSAIAGYVSEPTVLTSLESWFVPPTTGLIIPFPLGDEPEINASSTFGMGIRITAANAVSCQAYMRFLQGVS